MPNVHYFSEIGSLVGLLAFSFCKFCVDDLVERGQACFAFARDPESLQLLFSK